MTKFRSEFLRDRFTCRTSPHAKSELHTHAEAQNIVWQLGSGALTGNDDEKQLNGPAKHFWREFDKSDVRKVLNELAELPKIKIPGGAAPKIS